MCRAGHRVLVDAARRGKEARDKIYPAGARRGDDDREPVERGDGSEIGRQRGDIIGAVIHRHIIARGEQRRGPPAERRHQRL